MIRKRLIFLVVLFAGIFVARLIYLRGNKDVVDGLFSPASKGPIIWEHTAEEIRSICAAESVKFLKSFNELIARETAADAPTFASLPLAYEDLTAEFTEAADFLTFYNYVSTDQGKRDAADECSKSISKLFVEIYSREDFFLLVKKLKELEAPLELMDQKMLNDLYDAFLDNGLTLPADQRSEFIELKKKTVDMSADFTKRLNEWKETLEFSKEELDGLDESFLSGLEKKGEKYVVTLKYPHYFPIMQECKNPETRKRLMTLFEKRGGEENRKILEETLAIRARMAHLLGYKNHAEFKLKDRMAKTPLTVESFLTRLRTKLIEGGKRDMQELQALKASDPLRKGMQLEPWDWRYYTNLLKKTKYTVDQQALKEYFPMSTVLAGMFEIYQTLLGVEFKKVNRASTWHESVELYEVRESGGHAPVAYFYMDLYPREGKYGHAAAFTLISGRQLKDGGYRKPVSSIVANFNPPTESKESVLLHSEVETLFHEFGHIMHQILTKAPYASYAGTSVKRDFVEAPSQMLENWVWRKDVLRKISRHVEKGGPLPDDLLEKMLAAKNALSSLTYLRQLFFATVDLQYHLLGLDQPVDSSSVWAKLQKEIMQVPTIGGTYPQASFGHTMGGYDAGYYGYLWSEVFAADMFSRFESEGLINAETGRDYRRWILEPGGAMDPDQLMKGFLGREPDEKNFLKSIGLE